MYIMLSYSDRNPWSKNENFVIISTGLKAASKHPFKQKHQVGL